MSSLYQLTNEFMDAMDNINELIEEGMEISDHAYADTLEVLQMPLEEKCENVVKYIKSLEAIAEARKAEAKRLNELAAKDLKKAESLKNYMAANLQKANITKLQAGVFALSFRKGSEVVEVDETKIPTQYERPDLWVTQKPKFLGKAELKKMFKTDEAIPGVSIVRKPDTLVVK